ncbi:hypothetical protein [Inquilinus limosus]|uniref:Uncharacterized protein n=1 Tax=Inquilinus limosus TaxID=171674 RepID=A0A211ZK89_9PROT|nr:hypothetical protein [Inquilinus limosus]OWJ65682.1 hypothetical protein BWR60_18235 [Inquilinus limosus]
MSRSASSISLRVLAAYRSSREAGADEWSACETALEVVRRAHPEASPDFANTVVADVLREAYPPSRVTRRGQVEWPVSGAPRPSTGKGRADARL